MNLVGPLFFAFIAALGNAIFALGQKKCVGVDNTVAYTVLCVAFCVIFTAIAVPFFGKYNYLSILKTNWIWACVSGLGLLICYIGFNLLYTKYGTAHYVLYAILSIFTTTVIVGLVILRESFSLNQWIGLIFSVIAIILFTVK